MRQWLGELLGEFIDAYRREKAIAAYWRPPVLRLGDARHPRLLRLRELVRPDHFLPEDFLPGADTIVSYFLPFKDEVPAGNQPGREASELWARTYLLTNAMAARLNARLAETLQQKGYPAAVPAHIGVDWERLDSRWSQRHVAWFCGQGGFGLNNMLISDAGCGGRYFSIVAKLGELERDEPAAEEYCLHKKDGSCGVCVKRCVNGALTVNGFDRFKCLEACHANEDRHYRGAEVCGKCMVGLPCTGRKP